MVIKHRIVAEVTRNWDGSEEKAALAKALLSQQFEKVIETNAARGYLLESWQFQTVNDRGGFCETIIAVFTKENFST